MTSPGTHHVAHESTSRVQPDLLLLFAFVIYGIAVRPGPMSAWAVVVATLALGYTIWIGKRSPSPAVDSRWLEDRLFVAVIVFGVMGIVGFTPSFIGPSFPAIERIPGLLWIGLAVLLFWLRDRLSRGALSGVVVTTLALTGVFAVAHIEAIGDQGIDVYVFHVRTAEALANGDNPYTDAVTVPDGSPLSEPGDVIVGYVYPPVTAISYALGHWLTPDTRYTSLIAWLVVLGIVGGLAIRRLSLRHVLTMLLLAAIPGWWFLLRAGWTEPLSLMFMAIALVVWARPLRSGFGLGAALASKQYFFVSAPVVLLHRDTAWLRRVATAAVVVLSTVGAALVWDFSAFWDAAVAFHTSTPPRPDSANLVGLLDQVGVSWAPPAILPMVVGLGTAVGTGVGSTRASSFITSTAIALAASFLVSSQAFANYWFLIFGLCGLALVARAEEAERMP